MPTCVSIPFQTQQLSLVDEKRCSDALYRDSGRLLGGRLDTKERGGREIRYGLCESGNGFDALSKIALQISTFGISISGALYAIFAFSIFFFSLPFPLLSRSLSDYMSRYPAIELRLPEEYPLRNAEPHQLELRRFVKERRD